MSRSTSRNGRTVRHCVHCFVCHCDKLLGLPHPRDVRLTQDDVRLEIERYFAERDSLRGPVMSQNGHSTPR